MRSFLTVLKFELFNFLKNKVFKVSTIILCLLVIIGLTIPTIMDTFGKPIFGDKKKEEISYTDSKIKYGVLIKENTIKLDDLQAQLPDNELINVKNEDELSNLVISDNITAGFIVNSPTNYEYLVKNTSMDDGNRFAFESALLNLYRNKTLSEKGIDYNEVMEVYNIPMEYETTVLGKDGMKNYLYTYILIFGLYFVVLFYGQLTATAVASEKSNRTMEILVTSTSTKNLIFGKVIAGALAGIIQFGALILVASITYKLNIQAWDNNLDFIFNIPGNVLATFSIFGILGYLFYLFIYGVIGALVSRTEDVGTSSTPLTIVFIVAFFISMMGLTNPDMYALKVASFIPFTSFMAMFVRVSMGNVSSLQIVTSLLILAVSTIITGIFGAKIYRLGTLMYGNPIKITKAIKMLKDK
ncbi:ABC transporter permease [Tissierella sp.]|uniref:ABC transporter permease n=1 Tax=Tissierella sp. TaxID=41274 RepID=UPI0030271A2C